MSVSGAGLLTDYCAFLLVEDHFGKFLFEVLWVLFLLPDCVDWVNDCLGRRRVCSLFWVLFESRFVYFAQKFLLPVQELPVLFLLYHAHLSLGFWVLCASEPSCILSVQRLAVSQTCVIALRMHFSIMCNTLNAQPERLLFLIVPALFLFSVFRIQNWRRFFYLLFYCRWRFIKLICVFMNLDPFVLLHIEYHDIILLLCNLSDSTKQKDCFGLVMTNHRKSFSFIRPLLIFWRLDNFFPGLRFKIVTPHIVENNIRISAAINVHIIFNDACSETSPCLWCLSFSLNFLYSNFIIGQTIQLHVVHGVRIHAILRLIASKDVHAIVYE